MLKKIFFWLQKTCLCHELCTGAVIISYYPLFQSFLSHLTPETLPRTA